MVVGEGYGLTEASPVVTSGRASNAALGSIGARSPASSVRLVDADGDDVLVGDPGEIWVTGPNVFAGYWNDPEATARGASRRRAGSAPATSPVVDDDGLLFLVDRAKDLIIVSGFNVYPAEVEEVLARHPGVDDVGGRRAPSPLRRGREGVRRRRAPASPSTRTRSSPTARPSLARYKCPQKVMFVDELPQAATGKVLRGAALSCHVVAREHVNKRR